MRITNKHNLPEPIYQAVKWARDKYGEGDHGDISTTRLIAPPQIVALQKKYGDQLEEDVLDLLFALDGQVIHKMIEESTPADHKAETRVSATVNGWKVTGQYDMIDPDQTLVDYKRVKVWGYIYGTPEWELQANVNRWLLHKNGVEIKKLVNWLWFKDFINSKAGTGGGTDRAGKEKVPYPPAQMIPFEIPMWPLERAEKYVQGRVMLHQAAQVMLKDKIEFPDEYLANRFPCSDEERWLNKRTGKYNRCKDYCSVKSQCAQYQGGK